MDGKVPSWETVHRVVEEFPLLSQAQVRQLSDVLQERWRELQSETRKQAPEELIVGDKMRDGVTSEQQIKEKLVALIQKWREEVASYYPVYLLQGWVDKAHEDARTRYYTNEDVEMLYLKARERHGETLQLKPFLQVKSDPTFGLLRQKFPTCEVWTALNAWQRRIVSYIQAFYGMLKEIEHLAVGAWNAVSAELVKKDIKGVDWIDCVNFTGFEKMCKLERLLTVFVTCDLVAGGIVECPTDSYWARLTNDLEKLRLRMNVALSTETDISPKGGWISGIADLHAMSPDRLLEFTREFLGELAKLRSAEDSLIKALKMLENKI